MASETSNLVVSPVQYGTDDVEAGETQTVTILPESASNMEKFQNKLKRVKENPKSVLPYVIGATVVAVLITVGIVIGVASGKKNNEPASIVPSGPVSPVDGPAPPGTTTPVETTPVEKAPVEPSPVEPPAPKDSEPSTVNNYTTNININKEDIKDAAEDVYNFFSGWGSGAESDDSEPATTTTYESALKKVDVFAALDEFDTFFDNDPDYRSEIAGRVSQMSWRWNFAYSKQELRELAKFIQQTIFWSESFAKHRLKLDTFLRIVDTNAELSEVKSTWKIAEKSVDTFASVEKKINKLIDLLD